jgi:uncharacterized membrane protein
MAAGAASHYRRGSDAWSATDPSARRRPLAEAAGGGSGSDPVSGATAGLLVAVFLACAVEAVEAVTIVLAMGLSRGWRGTLAGAGAGLLLLAVIVAALGPAVAALPITALRLVVGGLLLIFGLQWLRKAILRASGHRAVHDEAAIFARETAAAAAAGGISGRVDPYAFTVAFKGVLLEGLEVVFIVLTFGGNQGRIGLAAVGGAAAVIVVLVAALTIRAPLSRVPENTIKYAVGTLLTSFGLFWATEGAGADWPGGDAALPFVIAFVLGLSLVLVRALSRTRGASPAAVGRT